MPETVTEPMQDYYLRCNYIAIDEAIGTLVKVALTKGSAG